LEKRATILKIFLVLFFISIRINTSEKEGKYFYDSFESQNSSREGFLRALAAVT
jgi:hypothetical protein